MEESSDSSPKSSRGRISLCGFSGSMKSTTKESQPHNRKSLLHAFRRSPQKHTPEDTLHGEDLSAHANCEDESSQALVSRSSKPTGEPLSPKSPPQVLTGCAKDSKNASRSPHSLELSPITKVEASISENLSADSQDTKVNKPSLKQRWNTFLRNRKRSPNESGNRKTSSKSRSLFNRRKKKIDSSKAQPGGHDDQRSSDDTALIPGTSHASSSLSKSKSAKNGHQDSLLEIKSNIVSERLAAFSKLSGEQPEESIPGQPRLKSTSSKVTTEDNLRAGSSPFRESKSSCKEGPSCSHQSAQPEPMSSSSAQLEPTDVSGTNPEEKKNGKRSAPFWMRLFKSKRTSRGVVKNVQEKSKGDDKRKAKNKESAGDKGKSFQDSLAQEKNKFREPMMKAIYKGVQNLTVPELPKPVIAKSSPAINQEATLAAVDSPSKQRHVEIPSCDDDELFFPTPKNNANLSDQPAATTDNLDFLEREPILQSAKKARPQKNQRPSTNPIKNLAERKDLVTSYVETQRNVKQETNRSSGFTKEALAGLASKEDFNRVVLRKVDSSPANQHQPFKERMLLLVKGRKYCHGRLVDPCARSINAGDCYVLVMPNSVHVWLGDSCNVLEKSKATDVAKQIVVKRDLGCKVSAGPIVIGEETKLNLRLAKDFWSILGEKTVPTSVQGKVAPVEDEIYERSVNETNVVYKVCGTRLQPLDEYCGKMLSYDMLNTNGSAVLIFDFGGEMYVWIGKQSQTAERQYGMQLAEALWVKGYDYTSFRMNPLSPLYDKKNCSMPVKSHVRPAWALLGKLNQGTETILFKEKFFDWPDPTRIIKCKSPQSESKEDPFVELQPCDVNQMIKSKQEPVSFIWEGIHIGRCLTWVSEADGLKKEYELETEGIDVWHVAEFACNETDEAYHGQYFEGDTYVVRWRYHVNNKGLVGKNQSSLPGRSRCAYFFWQGEGSSVTEKGACALMTVELDKEKGPQVRVVQNKEPPCFLALFKGRMIVHKGKKDEKSASGFKSSRLYMVRNELPEEAYLMEIEVQPENLRSRSSFLLLNAANDQLTIWHGVRSPKHTRLRARELTNALRKWLSLKFSCDWKMSETVVNEGSESTEFWNTMGSSDRCRYDSLLKSSVSVNCSLRRAFHLSGVTSSFEATEILNPSLNENLSCPFPLFQSDLYQRSQPALFLIDSCDVVYLWQGFWPLESDTTENLRTGSAGSRFSAERLCAMETVLAYCKAVNPTKPAPAYVVYAGVEPVAFTNLFPSWHTDEAARTSSLEDGKKLGQMTPATEALANMKKNQYTLAELQSLPLPDGVDPLKLESYLTDEEFKNAFDCDKIAFYLLPDWQQRKIKKTHGLF